MIILSLSWKQEIRVKLEYIENEFREQYGVLRAAKRRREVNNIFN